LYHNFGEHKYMDTEFQMKLGIRKQLAYAVIFAFFFLGYSLLYNPFNIEGYYSFGNLSYTFHLMMITCIILVCSISSRILLYFILKEEEYKWMNYLSWCLGEMFLMSLFAAMYTRLFKGAGENYFNILADCAKFIFLSLCYPYVILILLRITKIQKAELERRYQPTDNSLVRFYDEHKRLKLSIAPSSILYVSSEFNYITIHYLDAGKVKEYRLRASLKSLETINSKNLVRCQRSYFVNPEHITVLRRDPEGFIFAELNIPEVPAVPVSKQYYNSLSALL